MTNWGGRSFGASLCSHAGGAAAAAGVVACSDWPSGSTVPSTIRTRKASASAVPTPIGPHRLRVCNVHPPGPELVAQRIHDPLLERVATRTSPAFGTVVGRLITVWRTV